MKQEIYDYIQQIELKLQNREHSTLYETINELKSYVENNDIDERTYKLIYKLLDAIDESIPETNNIIINERKPHDAYKSVIIKAYIIGLGKKFYRIMEIPYDITLADLAYFVLSTFKASGYHLFSVKYKKEIFVDRGGSLVYLASNVYLSQLNLQPKSQLDIEYDYGDEWKFKVTIQSIHDHDDKFDLEDSYIIRGKGYGIWEDEATFMHLYYRSYPLFLDVIKDNDMEEKDFVIKEFDLNEANKNLISSYHHMKNMYQ
ncbi:MAG: plasmid pRiA4b ORF-3 family protein [Erysipelotrichaceae bacterium]|nr:plasmid pRiA4b ORF-3 family protein [Erysipelotrichaceae bacterium]